MAQSCATFNTLASFAVFDTRCARSYLDEDGDLTYSPYGMDILRGLAEGCGRLRAKLDGEANATILNTTAYTQLAARPTAVGKLLGQLSTKTRFEEIETLAALKPEEIERRELLRKAVEEGDPKDKAQQLRLRAERLTALLDRYRTTIALVNDARSGGAAPAD